MKYLTKKWYSDCQLAQYHVCLRIDDTISDDSVDHTQKIMEDTIKEDLDREQADAKEFGEEYDRSAREKECREGMPMLMEVIDYSIMLMPDELRAIIPNERLKYLAMNTVTNDDYRKIERICEEKRISTEKAQRDYWDHFKTIESQISEEVKQLNMHDSRVDQTSFDGNDLIMKIAGCFTDITEICFINAKIIEGSCDDLRNITWLYDEIYLKERYELHVLYWSQEEGLTSIEGAVRGFALTFDDIRLKHEERNNDAGYHCVTVL